MNNDNLISNTNTSTQ